MKPSAKALREISALYEANFESFNMFSKEIATRVTEDREVVSQSPRVVYTVKARIKEWESLREKIHKSARSIDGQNFLKQISDIAGVRVVVLHRSQVLSLHKIVIKNVQEGRWRFREKPTAYEADALAKKEFKAAGFQIKEKDTYYTSVHYLLEQASDRKICCELQIRTIFEEVWGEVDHFLRYKAKIEGSGGGGSRRLDHELRTFSHITNTARSALDLIFLPKSKT
jgi:putative GTP pyrophosphokinase